MKNNIQQIYYFPYGHLSNPYGRIASSVYFYFSTIKKKGEKMEILQELHGGGSSAGNFLVKDIRGRVVVMKFANWSGIGSNGIPWLKSQFDRLKDIKESLQNADKDLVPEVYEYGEDQESAFYTLQYYEDGKPLSTYHLENTFLTKEDFLKDLDKILYLLAEKLYSQEKLDVPSGYLERVHKYRLNYRLGLLYKKEGEVYEKLIKNRCIKITGKNHPLETLFSKMWNLDKIVINNIEYENTRILWDRFNCSNLLEKVKPSFLPRLAHGDALLRNFMKLPNEELVIFDVRGTHLPNNSPARIDIPYELGKLLHGILLEIIRNDLFTLEIDEHNMHFHLNYDLNNPSIDKFLKVRESMPSLFKNNISIKRVLSEEENWLNKAIFAEATHFLADAINRLENDETGRHTVAYYLIDTMLLNKYMQLSIQEN